jgi:ribose transport system substrate-binding protein
MQKSFKTKSLLVTSTALALALLMSGRGGSIQASSVAQATAAPTDESAQFLSMGDMTSQLALAGQTPVGDPKTPWLQYFKTDNFKWVDTTTMKKPAPWHLCFSNAGLDNNWRVTAFGVMQAEVKLNKDIGEFTVTDAQGKDEKQIADIDDLLTKKCDALIISPNTTAALTPEVEKAAKTGIPVILFDRGVNTTSYTTFIHPIGGYAFGYVGAKYLADTLGGKGNILALRILPGVDVLETRWLAARQVFAQNPGMKVVGVEFDGNDVAKTKSIVTDYLSRGQIDGVWMDAGEASAGVYEAFVDAGQPVPPITSEDVNVWLKLWTKNNLKSIAPTYPGFQWRTAVIAATMILGGQQVPKEWILPQPSITNDTVKDYVQASLPDTYYIMSRGDTIPGYLDTIKTK